ncbi:MAG: acyl--CoA ligase [Clostridia bacterium]|nr:acyl--CoA ligase [Clostridia bacterium]
MTEQKLTGYPSIDKPWLKYYSEEAINAPLPECTIYEYLWDSNKDHLDDIALNYFDRKITYGELFENIEKAAKAFSTLGVKEGDIVVMATVTTPETIYAFYGLNRLGAISNMVDPRTSTEGIRSYISEVNAKFVLTIDAALPKIENAVVGTKTNTILVVSPADSLPQPKKSLFLLSNKLKGKTPKLSDKCISWAEFIEKGLETKPAYSEYKKGTCCVIVHTGGTTGTPKGVMLSNDSLNIMVVLQKYSNTRMKRKQSFLDFMPPFIAYGLACGIHNPLNFGMTLDIVPKFDPSKFDKLIISKKPNHAIGVPSYWQQLANGRVKNLSFIQNAIAGGDRIDPTQEKLINNFFNGKGCKYKLSKGYGLTELASTATYTVCDNCNLPDSVGIPLFLNNMKIVDSNLDKEVTYNQEGEICISSPTMMLGYYNNESATNDVIKKDINGNKWFYTGDSGYINEDGLLFVVGRIKRMIVRYDGFKIFPSQIEDVLLKNKNVDYCCAVGIADKNHSQGQLPIVFVVKNGNESNDEVKSELFELCKKELPEYAQPIDFVSIDALPLTPIGKIDYRALEKQAEELSNA